VAQYRNGYLGRPYGERLTANRNDVNPTVSETVESRVAPDQFIDDEEREGKAVKVEAYIGAFQKCGALGLA